MSTKISKSALTVAALAVGAGHAGAATVLNEKDSVQAFFTGFAQFDIIGDSTRSLPEIEGNNAIDKKGSYKGDNGRLQFSTRNSRLGFGLMGKSSSGWKNKGYIELDLLGYEPNTPEISEAAFYQNPTVRMRHAYLQSEGDGWNIIAGQYWSLFGWQADTVLSTVGYAPIVGELYERKPQVTLIKTLGHEDDTNVQIGGSISRPTQRESATPNIEAGLRLRLGQYRAAYTSTSGDVKSDPMSIGVSGTLRDISSPKFDEGFYPSVDTTTKHKQKNRTASALAVDVMIPLVGVAKGADVGNSLALTGEFTRGTGYADELSGWSGNLMPLVNGKPTGTVGQAYNYPNLDGGIAGYKADDLALTLVHLQTWNSSLQYHLPTGFDTFITGGFSELWSDNAAELTAASGKQIYTRNQAAFGNIIHDFNKEMRAGFEYNWARTRYADNSHGQNNRFQVSTWYRF